VPPVTELLKLVLLVLKITEDQSQDVTVMMDTMITMLSLVCHVSINAEPVQSEETLVVISVEKIENHNLNQTVHVETENTKMNKLSVLLVTENVTVVLLTKPVAVVPISESTYQIVNVQLVGMMMVKVLNVSDVKENVPLVPVPLITVPLVPPEEPPSPHLVNVQVELLKS
jgi:hypothetical protein